jgi:hypothetical protein
MSRLRVPTFAGDLQRSKSQVVPAVPDLRCRLLDDLEACVGRLCKADAAALSSVIAGHSSSWPFSAVGI